MTAYPTLFLGSSSTNTLKSTENTLALADHQYSKKMHHDHLYAKPQDVQPSTSKMKDLDVNLTVPNIPQGKQSIQNWIGTIKSFMKLWQFGQVRT